MIPNEYRVWSLEDEIFVEIDDDHWDCKILPSGKVDCQYLGNEWEPVKVEIDHFTGFIDCHGSKVFENDIVKTNKGINYIDFQDFGFTTHDDNPLINYMFSDRVDSEFEVIGNVHENPELLEVGHEK